MTGVGLTELGFGERATRVSDGASGWTETWAAVAVDVPCKVDLSSGRSDELGGTERGRVTGRLYVPASTDIARDDRWTVTGGVIDPVVVTVLAVRAPGSRPHSFDPHLEVDVEQIQTGT